MHDRLTTKPATAALQDAAVRPVTGNPPGGDGESDAAWRERMQADHCDGTTYGVRHGTLVCGLVAGVCLIGSLGIVVWLAIWGVRVAWNS